MKTVILNALVVLMMTMMSCDKEEMIQEDQLPAAAQTFLKDYFAGDNLAHAKKEKEGLSGKEYEAYLASGTKVTFNKDGDWVEVDGPENAAIPTGFVAKSIVDYVAEKYPSANISSIEKDRNEIEVELTNGIDLVFGNDGAFKRVD